VIAFLSDFDLITKLPVIDKRKMNLPKTVQVQFYKTLKHEDFEALDGVIIFANNKTVNWLNEMECEKKYEIIKIARENAPCIQILYMWDEL
jgi:hypothetical protein